MESVRVGIIGIGNMGRIHARYLQEGEIAGAKLVAVCDINQAALDWVEENIGAHISRYQDSKSFFNDEQLDAVIISTPHYSHPELAIAGFAQGLHVMVEKPAGVYTKQIREMNEAADKSGKVFSAMFCIRTNPLYQKVRDLLASGELGSLKRINWIVTNAYRSQSYYNSGGWRATWGGEGGGVLMNQAPHQLDLWQWLFGLPERVRAFCAFGKYHEIEVEDDVTAYMEYKNGATGVFITSTGETPGSNRLEVIGDRGKLLVEENQLKFWRLRQSEREFNSTFTGGFGSPENWECNIPIKAGPEGIHAATTQNWIDAILTGSPLLAPGQEGIKSVELANAMHLSTWEDQWAELPVAEERFYAELQKRVQSSTIKKEVDENQYFDASKSY